ncbi:MAG: hypothetical protein QXQ38_05690 [Archaeoglobaceae archaeon]|nr:hypothetical protein [Archaeoglobales archaeon]MDI9642470.1 hypothetical protein [Archaeoglobales archaeon]
MSEFLQTYLFILTSAFLLLGGALILQVYNAYHRTKQKFLLLLSFGFFTLVIGGALPVLAFAMALSELMYLLGIILQICGISAIYYSTVRG